MCLRAGVHVFVEKPLAISWEQLNDLKVAYAERTVNAELMVGFNRRFSPAVRKLGDALAGRRGPIMVNYRVNAGAIPLDHWTQGAEGGGRNLGEACHMYDVFRFLAAAPAIEVSAQGVFPETGVRKRNDNFTAMITYADGSVGVLTYTSLGPKDGLGKERVEVFCDGDVYIIDDFKSLVRGSDMQVLWQASAADKGHLAEFQAMADSLVTSGAMPIPVEELFETTAVSLNVEDVLRGVQTDAADPALD
jgi:predicted dehydrogenase